MCLSLSFISQLISLLYLVFLGPSPPYTPITKRPHLSTTDTSASTAPSTSNVSTPTVKHPKLPGFGTLNFSSTEESENENSSDGSDSDDSISKKKRGKPKKRKSNKHNGRKRKNDGRQSESDDGNENEASSGHSDSDESLPENEEFPVVLNPESSQAAGKYTKDKTKPLPKATFFALFSMYFQFALYSLFFRLNDLRFS